MLEGGGDIWQRVMCLYNHVCKLAFCSLLPVLTTPPSLHTPSPPNPSLSSRPFPLLCSLKEFNEWSQCLVMQTLTKYTPADEEEMYDMLNVLDDRLNHANSGVVMGAVCLFLHLTEDCLEMHADVYERIKSGVWPVWMMKPVE